VRTVAKWASKKPGSRAQPILLLYPLPWGILGTREDERRTPQGPLGLLFLGLNKTHSAIEL